MQTVMDLLFVHEHDSMNMNEIQVSLLIKI